VYDSRGLSYHTTRICKMCNCLHPFLFHESTSWFSFNPYPEHGLRPSLAWPCLFTSLSPTPSTYISPLSYFPLHNFVNHMRIHGCFTLASPLPRNDHLPLLLLILLLFPSFLAQLKPSSPSSPSSPPRPAHAPPKASPSPSTPLLPSPSLGPSWSPSSTPH